MQIVYNFAYYVFSNFYMYLNGMVTLTSFNNRLLGF